MSCYILNTLIIIEFTITTKVFYQHLFGVYLSTHYLCHLFSYTLACIHKGFGERKNDARDYAEVNSCCDLHSNIQ